MITYGSACCSINHEMLHAAGLIVDQCYTVARRESKYTLIHLPKTKRVRISAINKAMRKLREIHGVIEGGVFGFNSVACNIKNTDDETSIESHPGFKRLIETLNKNRGDLEWWMGSGDLINNKKGLLWKFIEDSDVETMTKSQLIKRAREWETFKVENKALKQSLADQENQFQQQVEQFQILERELQKTKESRDTHRKNADEMIHKYAAMSEKCMKLMAENARLRSEAVDKDM